MAHRPSLTLQLSTSLKGKIARSGYVTVDELCSLSTVCLESDLVLSHAQQQELVQQIRPSALVAKITATYRWNEEKNARPITTSSSAIDGLFPGGGGVPLGTLTDFSGLSGTGKTQLGMQLCINVQIPVSHGGADGTAIFIDSEGGFIARRAQQICTETSRACEKSPVSLMQGIQYCRVHSPVELLALVKMLPSILATDRKVKLLVVDTISFLFRSNLSDLQARANLIGMLGQQLSTLAKTNNIAVVVLNQMTSKFELGQGQQSRDGDQQVHPAMGEAWASICVNRICLANVEEQRTATIYKSTAVEEVEVPFQIATEGIADVIMEYQREIPSGDQDGNDIFFWDASSC
ncbi:MAG: Rad51-domain-containing protein [Podila humilis]|nr:MAG: Rad51-domain-containing protein [Podila humilis]